MYKKIFLYPSEDLIRAFNYDEYWKEKRGDSIGIISSWQKDRADFILEKLKEERSLILADVGCGDGSVLHYLKNRLTDVTKCIGYDTSEFALLKAQEYGIETTRLDISKRESYDKLAEADYYFLLETLEHIPHSEDLLIHSLKKSRKGVFFSFPNTGYITYRIRLLLGKFPLQWRIAPNEHVRFWTYRDLQWWLGALHIQNYEIYCYRGIPLLNKLFPSIFAAGLMVFVSTKLSTFSTPRKLP